MTKLNPELKNYVKEKVAEMPQYYSKLEEKLKLSPENKEYLKKNSKKFYWKAKEFYKTAALFETIAAINFAGAYRLHQSDNFINDILSYGIAAGGLAMMAVGKESFDKKKRLEKIIKRDGFDKRFLNPYMFLWCDRQVARVVAEKYGHLEDYKELYHHKKIRDQMRPSWIPNF